MEKRHLSNKWMHWKVGWSLTNYLDNQDWSIISDDQGSLREKWEFFLHNIQKAVNQFIPRRVSSGKSRPKLMKAGLLDQVKEKHKRNRSDDNWKMFVRARNKTTRYFERRITVEVKTNQKSFWNMVRDKYMTKPGITEIDYNGVRIIDDADKAECLNQFFASVFTEENTSIMPKLADIDNITYLETITITEQKVKKLLAKLKTEKSPGSDGIHNKVIYEAREQLLYPLTEMFRTSMETGDIPPEWKMADVVPIFKKGLKSDPNNYRPVSLTSTIGKLLETLVRNAIQDHLVCNKLMCDETAWV